MAKETAFLFYPGDWLSGTLTMCRSHKGAYMDLLMAQHNNGHMSLEDIKTVLGADFEEMWESKLKKKFKQDANGLYYNQKLEEVINERAAYKTSRLENLKGKKKHMDSHMDKHMDSHMDNHMDTPNGDPTNLNKAIYIDINNKDLLIEDKSTERRRFKKPTIEEIEAYCQERQNGIDARAFFDHYEARGWIPKGYTTQMKDWKAAVRTWEGHKKSFNNSTTDGINRTDHQRRGEKTDQYWHS